MIPRDTERFIAWLLARRGDLAGHLTLTALRPGQPTPSRHVHLCDSARLQMDLHDLLRANRRGWGAFVGMAWRRHNLGRWRRGGDADLLALPVLFADVDRPPPEAMPKILAYQPAPSCIVGSGRGVHAYWKLDAPTSDFRRSKSILQRLAADLGGDHLALSQILRLPGSVNTKPQRGGALCRILHLEDNICTLDDFPEPQRTLSGPPPQNIIRTHGRLNPALIQAVTDVLYARYGAFRRDNSAWIGALCPYGHAQDHPGAHFYWNPSIGLGHCFGRHHNLRLRELCEVLGLHPQDYGGVYAATVVAPRREITPP